MFTVYVQHFNYNTYYTTDQDVGAWPCSICRAQISYNFSHDMTETLMRELSLDWPTAVSMFHKAIVRRRQMREVQMHMLEDLLERMEIQNVDSI